MKKLLALLLCLLLAFCVIGCGEKPADETSSLVDNVSSEPEVFYNPLTGLAIDKSLLNNRPVAVMINNAKPAQAVQAGLNSFDILYETEVEGGITRMMGVTKDIASMPQIGTVRSARYPYLDLALGHDAVYVHAGLDKTYFAAHKKELGITTIDINSADAKYGFRDRSNGLASEHTLYTTGEKLNAAIDSRSLSRTTDKNSWLKFAEVDAPATPEAPCTSVTVPFSSSYISGFSYDATSGKYIKNSNGNEKTDYVTGQKLKVTNVFILFTDIQKYPDGLHVEVELNGGKGYYVSAGGYKEITWSKGGAYDALTFKNADGTEFVANAGNSYICLVKKSQETKVKFIAE